MALSDRVDNLETRTTAAEKLLDSLGEAGKSNHTDLVQRLSNIEGRLAPRQPTPLVIGICITVFSAVVIGFGSWTVNRIMEHGEKLAAITERIEILQRSLPARSAIEVAASIAPARLAKEISLVDAALKKDSPLVAKPSDASLAKIQSNLRRVDSKSPGYWPLVFDLVNYRSVLVTGMSSPRGKQVSLEDVTAPGQVFRDVTAALGGLIVGVTFENSWVIFSAQTPVTLRDVHFEHCVLVFQGYDMQVPPPAIEQLGRKLLAVDIVDFRITSGP